MLRIANKNINKNKCLFKMYCKTITYQENEFNIYIKYCFISEFIFIKDWIKLNLKILPMLIKICENANNNEV